jgi:hypothetical protein
MATLKTLFVIATLVTGDKCPCLEKTTFDECVNREPICLRPARDGTYKFLANCEVDRKHFFGDDERYQCVDIRSLFK